MTKNNKYDSLGYYDVLKSDWKSSDEEIRTNYRELAKFWHPDHNNDKNALTMFQKISTAYDVLKDRKSRLRYSLLSIIYDKNNFPDMNALCLLRNIHGLEDLNLRSFHLIEITGKGLIHSSIDKTYFCTQSEATAVIKSITRHNWIYGFLGLTAIFANLSALYKNIININNRKDNLLLLLHNAITYDIDNKPEEAAILAGEARLYAHMQERELIDEFLKLLNTPITKKIKKWNFAKYKYMQLIYPLFAFSCIFLICGVIYLKQLNTAEQNATSIKEIVIFQDGKKVFNDFSVNKFFDIPVDITDTTKLFHVTKNTNAMHGADDEFDVMKRVEAGETVRLTGRTADEKWCRVMFDNGEMGFIKTKYLKQGIGNEIPLWSKIYRED